MDRGAWRAIVYGITKSDTTELLDTFTGNLSAKTSSGPCIPVLPRSGDSVPSPTGHPLPLASRSRDRSGGGQALSDLPGGRKGPTKVRQIPWHMSDTGRAQQGAAPIQTGLQVFSGLSLRLQGWSWTRALTVVTADLGLGWGGPLPSHHSATEIHPHPTCRKERSLQAASVLLHPVYTQLYTIYRNLYIQIYL